MTKSIYETRIQDRSLLKFYLGLLPRFKRSFAIEYSRYIAVKKGATIGKFSVIPLSLAKKANANLVIGNHTSIQTSNIDLRSKVTIGNNVIIGQNVEIITASHNIHSEEWEQKNYGITIEDYVWIATNVLILPSCRTIGYGAVCGGGAVLVKNIASMSVVSGNPAVVIGERKTVHKKLVIESLLGGDLKTYIKTYKKK